MTTTNVTIGEFSQMTHLTVKTLRHYHRVGLLAPVDVDPRTGYRYYSTDQVPTAQLIRRYRDLDMPVGEVRAVVTATDPATRDALIATHLDRLQDQLAHTRSAVASLRSLLEPADPNRRIEHRSVAATTSVAVSDTVDAADLARWWSSGFTELADVVAGLEGTPTGPAGGLFAKELFEHGRGRATLFLPVGDVPVHGVGPDQGRVHRMVVPAVELAVLVHDGPHDDVDLTYGALGTYVLEHGMGAPGPVRESYLFDPATVSDPDLWRTEIGWPITPAVGTVSGPGSSPSFDGIS